MKVKALSIIILVMLLLSMVTPINLVVSAEEESNEEVRILLLRAKLLQNILMKILETTNISVELRVEMESLVKTNISALKPEELEVFIGKAEKILELVKEDVIAGKYIVPKEEIVKKFKEVIRNRTEKIIKTLNISEENTLKLIKKLEEVKDIKELREVIKELRKIMETKIAEKMSEDIWKFMEKTMAKFRESAAEEALELAYEVSSKSIKVLEHVVERLKKLNASPVAIAAIELAIERIKSAREVLLEVKELARSLLAKGNETREAIRNIVSEWIVRKVGKLNETIKEYVDELRRLREIAIRHNRTDMIKEIDALLLKIENITKAVTSGNITIDEAFKLLVEINVEVKGIEEFLEKIEKHKEIIGELIKDLSEELFEIRKEYQEILMKFEHIEKTLEKVKNITMIKLIPETMRTMNKTKYILMNIDAMLNSIEEALAKGSISKAYELLHNVTLMLKHVEKAINEIEAYVEHIIEHVMEVVKELEKEITIHIERIKILNKSIEELVREAKRINATKALEALEKAVDMLQNAFKLITIARKAVNITDIAKAKMVLENVEKLLDIAEETIENTMGIIEDKSKEFIAEVEEVVHTIEELYKKLGKVRNVDNPNIAEQVKILRNELDKVMEKLSSKEVSIEDLEGVKRLLDDIEVKIEKLLEIDDEITELEIELTSISNTLIELNNSVKVLNMSISNITNISKVVEAREIVKSTTKLIALIEDKLAKAYEALNNLNINKTKTLIEELKNTIDELKKLINNLKEIAESASKSIEVPGSKESKKEHEFETVATPPI